jgi:hypothetical protein
MLGCLAKTGEAMSKKIFDYITWLILASAALAVCSAALLMFSWVPVLWSEPAAAWVQAVGSVAAILGAFVIGERQSRAAREHALELDRVAQKRKNDSVLAIAAAAHQHVIEISNAFQGEAINLMYLALEYNHRNVDDVIDAIAAVPLHELGSADAVTSLLGIKTALMRVHEIADNALKQSAFPSGGRQHKPLEDEDFVCAKVRGHCGASRHHYEIFRVAMGA